MVHFQICDAEGRLRRLPAQPAFERDFIQAVTDRVPWYLRLFIKGALTKALHAVIKDAHDLTRPRLHGQ